MNPFIPINLANIAIVDARINKEIEDNLKRLGMAVVKTIKCEDVDDSISYHPDIVIHPLNHNTLLIAPNVFEYYREAFSCSNIKLIKGEKVLQSKYPDDIAYNVGRLKDIAIHNFKYTDPVLKYYLEKEDIKLVDVKQGYSKCSLALISDDIAISSDKLIYNKLTSMNYKVLFIKHGHIKLEGQKYGFIGGTNGNISKNKVIFSGRLSSHPDAENIERFLSVNNIEAEFLSNEKINDIGTIITLYCK